MRPWKVEWMGDGLRAGSGEQTFSGAPWAVGGRLAGWPLTPTSLRRVPTASRPATSPSPCSRHSMAFGRCPRLDPRPSPRLPSMRRSPTQASRTACHKPAVHLPGLIGWWKAACRRANPGASPPTGEPSWQPPAAGVQACQLHLPTPPIPHEPARPTQQAQGCHRRWGPRARGPASGQLWVLQATLGDAGDQPCWAQFFSDARWFSREV